MDIKVGESHSMTLTVEKQHTAAVVGSGLAEVFATPMMIGMMENTAAACLGRFLLQGQSSVGTYVGVSHDAATPVGMQVCVTATITAVDRRKVEFDVEARDEVELIGRGTHTRFVVDNEKFMGKAMGKKRPE